MKITFLVPPVLDGQRPAERSAGCTRVVYFAPNIYELTVIGVVENEKLGEVAYEDIKEDVKASALAQKVSDVYNAQLQTWVEEANVVYHLDRF